MPFTYSDFTAANVYSQNEYPLYSLFVCMVHFCEWPGVDQCELMVSWAVLGARVVSSYLTMSVIPPEWPLCQGIVLPAMNDMYFPNSSASFISTLVWCQFEDNPLSYTIVAILFCFWSGSSYNSKISLTIAIGTRTPEFNDFLHFLCSSMFPTHG